LGGLLGGRSTPEEALESPESGLLGGLLGGRSTSDEALESPESGLSGDGV
jgi:hypothetical protein